MEDNKIGKAIAFLRKRAGYTQKDLAERLGISDKAVSKWERGFGLPDISYLRKLSILLDTDTDSLLAGDVVHHDSSWSGIIYLDDNVYGIGADTLIYDKPLIYYLLSYFLLVGIHKIVIIGSDSDCAFLERVFGDGKSYGITIKSISGNLSDVVDDIDQTGNIMLVYGRSLIYGVDQTRFFQKAMIEKERFTMMVLPKKVNQKESNLRFNSEMKAISSDDDLSLRTQYDFSSIPIAFFPSRLIRKIANYSDILSFISDYSKEQDVYVQMLDRGFVDIEIDNWTNVQEASVFMKIVQDKCGMNIYCLEEVAWRRGFISLNDLKALGNKYSGTEYGDYIFSLYERFS